MISMSFLILLIRFLFLIIVVLFEIISYLSVILVIFFIWCKVFIANFIFFRFITLYFMINLNYLVMIYDEFMDVGSYFLWDENGYMIVIILYDFKVTLII
jgi:hypothetical protein